MKYLVELQVHKIEKTTSEIMSPYCGSHETLGTYKKSLPHHVMSHVAFCILIRKRAAAKVGV